MQFTRLDDERARRLAGISALAFVLAGCGDESPAVIDAPADAGGFLPANAPPARGCGGSGLLEGTLYGALGMDIDWQGDALDCEGMPRPDGRGARLRFAGIAGEVPVAIIIAIPALEPAKSAAELAARVTLIEEGSGRFFSTADADNCWTDVYRQAPVDDGGERFIVDGRLYCIAPLAAVNGGTGDSVTITELNFRGLLDWGAG